MFCFGFTLGLIAFPAAAVALAWLGSRHNVLSREGAARMLNGIAIGLMQGKSRPPSRQLLTGESARVQDAAHAPARPNLLVEPNGANGDDGGAARHEGRAKRQRGQ